MTTRLMVAAVAWTTCLTACLAPGRAATPDSPATATTPPAAHFRAHKTVRKHAHHTAGSTQAALASPPAGGSAAAPTPAVGPAPVPNESVAAPIEHGSTDASVAPSVFQLHYPPQGDGYTTGSSSQALDDREAARATGVEVKVPLPQ